MQEIKEKIFQSEDLIKLYEQKENNEKRFNEKQSSYKLLKEDKNEKVALMEIKTHALWYVKGIENSKEIKQELSTFKTEEEFYKILNSI